MSTPLREISKSVRMAIAGTGATQSIADACGAMLLTGDPISAANEITLAYQAG